MFGLDGGARGWHETGRGYIVSLPGVDLLPDSGMFPCAVCRGGVGVDSIECSKCGQWVQAGVQWCSGGGGEGMEENGLVGSWLCLSRMVGGPGCVQDVVWLLPILTPKHLSLRTRGKVFNACVLSPLLHGSETWAPTPGMPVGHLIIPLGGGGMGENGLVGSPAVFVQDAVVRLSRLGDQAVSRMWSGSVGWKWTCLTGKCGWNATRR